MDNEDVGTEKRASSIQRERENRREAGGGRGNRAKDLLVLC